MSDLQMNQAGSLLAWVLLAGPVGITGAIPPAGVHALAAFGPPRSVHTVAANVGTSSVHTDTSSFRIDDLAWMSGYWEGDYGGVRMEEIWLEPGGGVMLGQHRDTREGSGAFFEYLRIEEREDHLAYIASPRGRAETEFRAVRQSDSLIVFENPDHDYPQQIWYWLDADGLLHARISGTDASSPSTEWVWVRRGSTALDSSEKTTDLRTVRTVAYIVPDLERARGWYAEAFETEPYFDEPFYVGFRIGDFELGLDPDTSAGMPGRGGVVAYWAVQDARAAFARLVELGAGVISGPTDVGGGVVVATVSDPFGNPIGVIEERR